MAGLFSSILASKPKIPKLEELDLAKEQQKAIAANKAVLPEAQDLAGRINDFAYQQLQKFLGQNIPGLTDIKNTVSGNILSQLRGEIPQDVQDQIMRSSAFKSLRGGYGGGGMSSAVTARDLGLTDLDLTNKGLDSATKWITLARGAMTPGQFDISNSFIPPEYWAEFTNRQNVQQFQRKYAANVNNANFSLSTRLGGALDAGNPASLIGQMEGSGGGVGGPGSSGTSFAGNQMASPAAQSWYQNSSAGSAASGGWSGGEADWLPGY